MTLLGVAADRLGGAVERLLAASELRREKRREKKVTAYDLRPLLLDLQVRPADATAAGSDAADAADLDSAGLWMRLRNSQDLGSGRADEVVAAIADELGTTAAVPSGAGSGETEAEGEPEAVGSAAPPPGLPVLEMLRPVRERLWLAEELGG
jgi:hypothetical protein